MCEIFVGTWHSTDWAQSNWLQIHFQAAKFPKDGTHTCKILVLSDDQSGGGGNTGSCRGEPRRAANSTEWNVANAVEVRPPSPTLVCGRPLSPPYPLPTAENLRYS